MNFCKLAIMLVALMGVVVNADWQSLNDSRECSDMTVKVLSSTDREVRLEVTLPGYNMDTMMVDGKECVAITVPGARFLNEKGCPMLPQLGTLVKVNNVGVTCLKVISKEVVEVKLPAPVIPSKGCLTRDINPDSVSFEFGPIYHQNAFYVEADKQFTIGEEFLMRDVRGVRLNIVPIIANHVTMTMQAVKKVVVSIECEGVSSFNVSSFQNTEVSPVFAEMYSSAFVNVESQMNARMTPDEGNKKLVVLTAAAFEPLLSEWLEFKRSKGFQVTVRTVAAGETADKLKSYLQEQYNANKFEYVVIVGDFEQVPTLRGKKESALADRCYVRLAGNDNYPDAMISRISGNNETEITTQLKKFIQCEKTPKAGNWYKAGITIASDQGSPVVDFDRAKWLISGGGQGQKSPVVSGGLKSTGYGAWAEIYDPSATASKVGDAINSGAGIICYIGHGSVTSWGTSGFSNSNVKNLRNSDMLPVIWSVACVNGKFDTRECFAEAFLRQPNGGACAMEAASTNEEWVPPCDKQVGTVNAYINNTYKTFGALEMAGCINGMKQWGDTDSSSGNMMCEQCNLFGDCTMEVYYPKKGE